MGSITKYGLSDGTIKYKAEVCVNKIRESERFANRLDAKRWILKRETELSANPGTIVRGKTTTDVFRRYAEEESPKKRGVRWERIRLKKLEDSSLGGIPLEKLGSHHALAYIAELEAQGLAPNSIIREMTVAKTAIRHALKWRWLRHFPWKNVEGPQPGAPREILISAFEVALIEEYAGVGDESHTAATYTEEVGIAFLLAIETAMRLGELTQIEVSNIKRREHTVYLPAGITKNGRARTVPLSTRAIELIDRLPKRPDGMLFGVGSQVASVLFRRIRARAGIKRGITFHDTRHLALTKLAEVFDVMELCRISGHQDPRQLLVYYNKSPADMAKKLNAEV